jgi:hypothetical protein
MYLLRPGAYRLFVPQANLWDTVKNVKGNFSKLLMDFFDKVSSGCVQFYQLFMRCAFWYKIDMHPLTIFPASPIPWLAKKTVSQSRCFGKINFTIMKKIFGFMGKVNERVLSLSDAFSDYMDDNYFPGASEEMDADTVAFEYENFLNTYNQ